MFDPLVFDLLMLNLPAFKPLVFDLLVSRR